MDASLSSGALIGLAVGQLVGIASTIVTVLLTHKQQMRFFQYSQQDTAARERLKAQRNEFYGPLRMLLKRTDALHRLFVHSLESSDRAYAASLLTDVLLPLNGEIAALIISKGHLLHSGDSATPYTAFLLHSDSLRLLGVSTNGSDGRRHIPFPATLTQHVELMFERVRADDLGDR